jgi:hypothetical protein
VDALSTIYRDLLTREGAKSGRVLESRLR